MNIPLQALLFDVDGTLADTERDGHRVAFNLAFREAGLDWDWDVPLYGELLSVTGGKERIRHYLAHFNTEFEAPADFDDFIADLHRAKTTHYTALLAEGRIPLRSGVARLLGEAREAGLRLAIATTTTPANVAALLNHTLGPESLEWFEVIAAGDIVPAKKPAPDIYEYTLQELDLPPAACLAFEDSGNGILASRGAGLKTVVTVNAYTRGHDFSEAALVLDQFGEPDLPCRVLGGEVAALNGSPYLDIHGLRRLHGGR
ncbi:MAG TPA: HAD family hydrolase [Chromatiales bacterium]|nr:HAD family hydrolase [Chromatiales bacterium]